MRAAASVGTMHVADTGIRSGGRAARGWDMTTAAGMESDAEDQRIEGGAEAGEAVIYGNQAPAAPGGGSIQASVRSDGCVEGMTGILEILYVLVIMCISFCGGTWTEWLEWLRWRRRGDQFSSCRRLPMELNELTVAALLLPLLQLRQLS